MEDTITKVDYLRFSLTDRCNLNCRYCSPFEKSQFLSREEVLRYEEMVRLVGVFVKTGIRKLRITGGEPLIKKDIIELVRMLRGINGLDEITMTTNGVYLQDFAKQLKQAGLNRINISLDTLREEKFKYITGYNYFDLVWQGIIAALRVGFYPVKLNVILMKGINECEIFDFAQLTLNYPLVIRFIEFFPTNRRSQKLVDYLFSNDEAKKRIISRFGNISNVSDIIGNGPAEYYKIDGAKGIIGFISSYTKDSCSKCNRIRIDCAGRISPCLFSGYTHDVRQLLRSDIDDRPLFSYIQDVFKIKSRYRRNKMADPQVEMSSIGG